MGCSLKPTSGPQVSPGSGNLVLGEQWSLMHDTPLCHIPKPQNPHSWLEPGHAPSSLHLDWGWIMPPALPVGQIGTGSQPLHPVGLAPFPCGVVLGLTTNSLCISQWFPRGLAWPLDRDHRPSSACRQTRYHPSGLPGKKVEYHWFEGLVTCYTMRCTNVDGC